MFLTLFVFEVGGGAGLQNDYSCMYLFVWFNSLKFRELLLQVEFFPLLPFFHTRKVRLGFGMVVIYLLVCGEVYSNSSCL